MKKISLLLAFSVMALLGYSQIYFEVNGLHGDSPQGTQVLSYSFGASNPVSIGGIGGGMSSGKVSFSSFNFMMQRGKISTELLKAVATGHHFDKATVKIYDQQGKSVIYQITFTNVMIESWQQSAGCGKKDCDSPTESVSIAYEKIKVEDFEHNTMVEYDLLAHRAN